MLHLRSRGDNDETADRASSDRNIDLVGGDSGTLLERVNERVPGLSLELPSEAQWEYACRAGTETATYVGPMVIVGENSAPVLDSIAWYSGNSGVDFDLEDGEDSSRWDEKQYEHTKAGTRKVGLKKPNLWGLRDMLGNAWEWCADAWQGSYEGASTDGSARAGAGAAGRVIRGGSWSDEDAGRARCVSRRRRPDEPQ
jgi:formylglycine-generating enzyme required for sulfatase activity